MSKNKKLLLYRNIFIHSDVNEIAFCIVARDISSCESSRRTVRNFYIENGAYIYYADRYDGATALHWAAFCGRDKLVKKLIEENAVIDQRDKSHNATPLGCAIQPLMTNDKTNTYHQLDCIKLLLKAGANVSSLNNESRDYLYQHWVTEWKNYIYSLFAVFFYPLNCFYECNT